MQQTILRTALLLGSLIFLLIACQPAAVDSSEDFDFGSSAQVVLPPDTLEDESRIIGSDFAFETLYALGLDLRILPYEADQNGGEAAIPGESPATGFMITLEDMNGKELFAGKTDEEGNLITGLFVPSAVDSARLIIEAEGFEQRTILLENLADISAVDRELPMLKQRASMLSMSLEGSGGKDDDGDGVPNDFDAFPNDPERAFVANVPTEGSITVAYEDLFGRARAGDADYNDFIVSYKLKIITNNKNMITDIEFNDITMVQKLAGYTHRFGFRIDSFYGGATIAWSSSSKDKSVLITKKKVKAPAEITVFEKSSADLVGTTQSFTVSFDTPQSMIDESRVERLLSPPPFNPYIYVYNTGHDIHLIDAEPLTYSKNPDDDFRDDQGFPWALLIPADWEHPAEGQRIEEVYPRFTSWRESWGEDDEDWYLGEVSENQPPYAVNGPAQVFLTYRFDEPYPVKLTTDAPGADLDPDGDAVTFDFAYTGSNLEIGIDSVKGILSVDTLISGNYQETVTVWTVDEKGLKSAEFTILIDISSPS